jgi:hypothetical protein
MAQIMPYAFLVKILSLFGIHELRNYARAIGVKSPTSKCKSTLIHEITRIKNGELAPHHTRHGRPSLFPKIESEELMTHCEYILLKQRYDALVQIFKTASIIIDDLTPPSE